MLKQRLYFEIEQLILQGATEFLLGGCGGFDSLAANILRQLKEKYLHIQSVLVVAYLNRSYPKQLYDYVEYPPLERVPKPGAIPRRNQYMVEKADLVVSYVNYGFGGAAKTLEYAKRNQKHIIQLGTYAEPIK